MPSPFAQSLTLPLFGLGDTQHTPKPDASNFPLDSQASLHIPSHVFSYTAQIQTNMGDWERLAKAVSSIWPNI